MDGHRVNKNSLVEYSKKRKQTVLQEIQEKHHVSQDVANALLETFNPKCFKMAIVNFILLNNHLLCEVETDAFHELIAATNHDAVHHIPMNHQTVRDWALNDYKGNKGIITEVLADAITKLHVTFDG